MSGQNPMDAQDLLSELLKLAQSLGISIRTAEACSDHAGALVRLKGKEVLFLDPSADLADRIDATAAALAGRPELQDHFLVPQVRSAIDRAAAKP